MTAAATPMGLSVGLGAGRVKLSLAQKFALAFLGLVAGALLINGAIDMALIYREARIQAVKVQQEKANAAAERVVQFVGEIEQQLGWTTRAEWARVSLEQRRYDFIRLLRQAAAITELVHVDGAGREQLKLSRLEPDQVGSNADYSADPRFAATLRDKIYYGPVTFRRGSEPYMTIGMVHAGGKPGATIADVNLKLAWDVVTSIRVGETGYAFITDPAGRLIAHPDMSLVLRNTDLKTLPQVAASRTTTADTHSAMDGIGPDGRRVLSANAKVPKVGWNVFVELPAAEALRPVWSALYQTLGLLALGVLLAGAAGTLLARRMVVPITELQAGAQKLGEGDLASRILVRSGDEIGALAGRFNVMAERIQESQDTLERRVEERTADLNESLAQQTVTSDILRVISQSPTDVTPVFDAIVEAAVRLLRTDRAFVMRTDGKTFTPVAGATQSGPIATTMPSHPVDPAHNFPSRVIVSKATLLIPDWSQIELPPHERAIQEKFGTCSALFLPLLRGDECVGVLAFTSSRVREFKAKQVALAESFRDQAMIALENTRLFNETKEALARQTATSDILRVISGSPTDVTPVFDAIVEAAVRLLACDGAHVLRVAGQTLAHVAAASRAGPIKHLLEPMPIDRDHNFPAQVVSSRSILHLPDWSKIELPPHEQRVREMYGVSSVLFLPLIGGTECLGVLTFARTEARAFTAEQIKLAESFCDQAVIAIQNTQLFNETKEALERQNATAEVLQVINGSVANIQPVFDTVAANAVKLCEAERAFIFRFDGQYLRAVASHNVGPELRQFIDRNPISPGRHSISARAAMERRTVHVRDVQADAEYAYAMKDSNPIRTMLAVPMLRGDQLIGTITIYKLELKPFSDKQIALVETFAEQAVIAIENARLFEEVQARTKELQSSLEDLRTAQDRLVQTEKLASLGQLTAGVAHEIKNPLNFVNNFADLSVELVTEIEEAIASSKSALDPKIKAEVDEIAGMLKSNLAKVVHHGRRADSIVKNMLAHSRESGGERRAIDLNATVDEALSLAYHGARAEKPGFNITLERDLDPAVGQIEVFPQEFTRVLLNLIGNGFHAANKKRLDGASAGFEPVLKVVTKAMPDRIEIRVRDNGTGIPDAVKARIFEPFFTTKPTGEGTGLGLSLSHDIVVKQHGGSLSVATEPGSFTEFTIILPRKIASPEIKR